MDKHNQVSCEGGERGEIPSKVMCLSAAVEVDGKWCEVGGWSEQGEGEFTSDWSAADTIIARIRRADGAPFRADRIRVKLTSALLNYAHVVVPDCGRHYVLSRLAFMIRAPLYRVSGQNAGFPFFALADEGGDFMLGFGIVNAPGEVRIHRIEPLISTRKALVGGDDRLTQHFEWAGPDEEVAELEVEVFASDDEPTWFHALRKYTDAIKRRENLSYPDNPDAWLPTWCTWPAWVSDEMCGRTVLENARIAKDLGIGTIILDDGWFGAGLDTEAEALNLGDYAPDPSKFEDLSALIAQMQEMGLKVMLWFASLPLARTSKAYEKLRKYVMYQDGEEYTSVNGLAMLCPACRDVRTYVADQIEHLLKTYKPDGFKVDLYNCLPHDLCTSTHHEHDVHDAVAAVEATMKELWERAVSIKPDVLIELKQDYGNVRLIRHGTMVRAGDTAYDLDTNTWRCGYAQGYAPVVHNDYLITSRHTTPRAMGLLMIRMLMSGVPTFGLHFPKFSHQCREVIKAWLNFYHENLDMFKTPRQPQNNDFSVWEGGTEELSWVIAYRYAREVKLPSAKRLFLINGTSADDLYLKLDGEREVHIVEYDNRLQKTSERDQTLRNPTPLPIRSGGMLDITY